jgi:hypothetical protein
MPEVNERAYYVTRAAKVAEQAEKATDLEISGIYRRMAAMYIELADSSRSFGSS